MARFHSNFALVWWGCLTASLIAIAFMAAQLIARSAAAAPHLVQGERIHVVDGDTVDLPCPSRLACVRERVRILNIDAPETRGARCAAERKAGFAATRRLESLLRSGRVSVARCDARGRCEDRAGRTLARLAVNGADVGEALIASGHALPWRDGAPARAQRIAHWCGRA